MTSKEFIELKIKSLKLKLKQNEYGNHPLDVEMRLRIEFEINCFEQVLKDLEKGENNG